MKKLLAALLMLPALAQAESFSMPNKNGGEIVISDRTCMHNGKSYDPLKQAYSYWNGGYLEGCWTLEDNMVKIIWLVNGQPSTRVYNITDFARKSGKAS
jgi:hypothetical protein